MSIEDKFQDQYLLEEVAFVESIEYLHKLWADFHLKIVTPHVAPGLNVSFISPKKEEFSKLYTILDYGNSFSSSRAEDAITGDGATGKLMNTVEKMIRLCLARIQAKLEEQGKQGDSGTGDSQPKIEVAFGGHEFPKRKAFEVLMGMRQRIEIVNYEPIGWTKRRLDGLEMQVEKGLEPNVSALRY